MNHTEHRYCGRPSHRTPHGFGPFSRGRGEHGRDGGRGPRTIDSTELRLVLMKLLEEQPRHGYDLMREIETRTAGAYTPSPGMVYPALTMLEEIGHIVVANSDAPKRLFTLSEAGTAHLDENRQIAEAALARLEALGRDQAPIDTGPIRRAMQNLATVLQQRLSGAPERQMLLDAADAIDEAARKIERL